MKSMKELRQDRDELDQQMRVFAESEEENIRKRIIEFLDRMKDEYGFYDIQYEVACFWEDPDSSEQIGLNGIVVSNC